MDNKPDYEEANFWIFMLSLVLFIVSFSLLTSDKVRVKKDGRNETVPVRVPPEQEQYDKSTYITI